MKNGFGMKRRGSFMKSTGGKMKCMSWNIVIVAYGQQKEGVRVIIFVHLHFFFFFWFNLFSI